MKRFLLLFALCSPLGAAEPLFDIQLDTISTGFDKKHWWDSDNAVFAARIFWKRPNTSWSQR